MSPTEVNPLDGDFEEVEASELDALTERAQTVDQDTADEILRAMSRAAQVFSTAAADRTNRANLISAIGEALGTVGQIKAILA